MGNPLRRFVFSLALESELMRDEIIKPGLENFLGLRFDPFKMMLKRDE
jgi:hypothetical protein